MESEYVCYPSSFVDRQYRYSRNEWLRYALNSMVNPGQLQLANPWYQTALADGHQGTIACVAGEFYRLEFDSKFDLWRLPRRRGSGYQSTKNLIKLSASLWVKVWRMLERMESMGRLPLPPSVPISANLTQQLIITLWLSALVIEGELMTPWLDYVPPENGRGFEAFRKQQQNDNRKLQGFENPFNEPCTRIFIENAIATAEEFDRFRKQFFTPMVKQRQSITAFVIKEGYQAFDIDGKPSRQGRRKPNE
jgi:hypothetical protein